MKRPPKHICLVRLSAIGDITHTLPVVNTIKSYWPQSRLTWIIGTVEHQLVRDIPDIEFISFNKKRGALAYLDLRRTLRHRRFDLLMLMQLSLRANLIPLFVNADVKLGFDRARSRNMHRFFINSQIPAQKNQHVLDSFIGFTQALGLEPPRLVWNRCYSDEDAAFADRQLPGDKKTLIISPCSRHPKRNWLVENYAEIADYAALRHAMRVVLTSSKSEAEYELCQSICRLAKGDLLNLAGKTTLNELAALLAKADILLSPDSGPAHIATCVGTPVIGLYANTNPERAAPYLSSHWCINQYPAAVSKYLKKDYRQLPWGTRVKKAEAMALITPQMVRMKLDKLIACLPVK